MTGTLREDLCIIMVISRRSFLTIRNVSDKIIENIKTHIL
jgi:hypothetical protein